MNELYTAEAIAAAKYQASQLDKKWRVERRTEETAPKWKLTQALRNRENAKVRYWELKSELATIKEELETLKQLVKAS